MLFLHMSMQDVAQWLSPADLRRARLVCQAWCGGLATLTTKAATPAETLVPQWKGQLEAMLQAFPCLQELTISSRLSSVAAQQLGVLATAKQLQVLNIPHAQALQDRSLLVSISSPTAMQHCATLSCMIPCLACCHTSANRSTNKRPPQP
jgi:hypothetical protein